MHDKMPGFHTVLNHSAEANFVGVPMPMKGFYEGENDVQMGEEEEEEEEEEGKEEEEEEEEREVRGDREGSEDFD